MPGVMQRKGKLPSRTLRVSFKSAFFSEKTTPPHLLIFSSIWLSSPLHRRAVMRGQLIQNLHHPKARRKVEAADVSHLQAEVQIKEDCVFWASCWVYPFICSIWVTERGMKQKYISKYILCRPNSTLCLQSSYLIFKLRYLLRKIKTWLLPQQTRMHWRVPGKFKSCTALLIRGISRMIQV